MVRRRLHFLFPLLMVLAMTAGCASHKAYVVARRDPQYSPNPTNRIALANHLKPRPEEEALCVSLTTELKQQGFHLVPQEEADYTLAYWIEDNWYLREIPKRTYDPGVSPVSTPMQPFPAGPAGIYSDPFNRSYRVTETEVDDSVPVQGIRLQLYYRPTGRTGRPQTVWEGYIDAGFKVSPEREPALLKTLLTFFGKDYAGRTRLVE